MKLTLRVSPLMSGRLIAGLSLLFSALPLAHAQTIDDGLMIPRHTLFSGFLYTHDNFDSYWEGALLRKNGNIGTLTTQTNTIYADYGVTKRLNVIGSVPYVMTDASQGVLASQSGWQDLTLAAKYNFANVRIPKVATAHMFVVPFWSKPMTDYTPDFMPLSIGTHSQRGGVRSTVFLQSRKGIFVNATGAYTWREAVTLDRDYFYTNNQFFYTSDVLMPKVVDYSVSPGYLNRGYMAQFTFSKIITQGGETSGDIRRQDAPFVSNRVIASKIGGMVMVPVPFRSSMRFRVEFSHVIDGRNVGQSNTIQIGLLDSIHFGKADKNK